MAGTPMTPITGVDRGQEYDFRGAQASDGIGTLLKGSAEAFGNVIDAEYKAVNTNIRQDARQMEEQAQNNLFFTSDIAASQAATTDAKIARPEDLTRGFDKIEKVKNAYLKGALTESDYLANVDVITKKLRVRYGHQWSDEIDSAVEAATSSSANRYRRQLFNELDSLKSASDKAAEKEMDRKFQFVKENLQYLTDHPDVVAGEWKNKSESELFTMVAPIKQAKEKIELSEAMLKVDEEKGKYDNTKAMGVGKEKVGLFVSQVVGGSVNGNKDAFMAKMEEFRKDGKYDTEEFKYMDQYFNGVNNEINAGIEKILSGPQYIKLPEEMKKEIRAVGTNIVDAYKQAVYNADYGAISLFGNTLKHVGQDALSNAMELDTSTAGMVAFIQAMNAGGITPLLTPEVLSDINSKLTFGNKDSDTAYMSAGMMLLGKKDFGEYLTAIQSTKEDPKKIKPVLKMVTSVLTNPKATPEQKSGAARALFNENSKYTISSGIVTSGAATDLFNDLTNPSVMKEMIGMKDQDRTAFVNYYDWIMDGSFQAVFRSELNSAATSKTISSLQYDPVHMQFSINKKVELPGAFKDAKTPFHDQNEITVNRLNLWIQRVTPLIKSEELDPNQQLQDLFDNLQLVEPSNGKSSLFEEFRKKIVKSNEVDKADGEPSP